MRILVVGYGPGGISAADAAHMFDSDAEIVIITEETSPAHRKPGSSLALKNPSTDELDIPDWSPESLKRKGIEILSGHRVISGDLQEKELVVVSPDGKEKTERYDKLILATGGKAYLPDIPGTDLEGVYTIQDVRDASTIGERLAEIQTVVVVGAGFSGLEVAERLFEIGKEVHIIIRSRLLRRLLEPELSEEFLQRIPSSIRVHKGYAPEKVLGDKTVKGLAVGDETIATQAVIFMTGVSPNVALAEEIGVKIGELGGVVVDERMQTSDEDVYAVGDCVQMHDFLTGQPVLMPIGSVAARAGRQAGVAATGNERLYPETKLRFQYDRIFDTDIVCMGHSSEIARQVDADVNVAFFDDNAEFAKIALVTDKDGRIVGGQVLASRMGSRIGYQILERMEAGVRLSETPLLDSRHDQIKRLLEETLGPIE
jgi:NADH oxidase (H2O2-forming)